MNCVEEVVAVVVDDDMVAAVFVLVVPGKNFLLYFYC